MRHGGWSTALAIERDAKVRLQGVNLPAIGITHRNPLPAFH